jgi:hypothetical protein
MSLIVMDFPKSKQAVGAAGQEDDHLYHSRRAEEELAIAQAAQSPDSRRFHYHLAALHLDRAHAAPDRRRVA